MPSRIDPVVIKNRMKECGFKSFTALSNHSGVSMSTIDRIINERSTNFNSQTVHLLANSLKCSPFDLYKEEALSEGVAMASSVAVADVVAVAVTEAVTAVALDAAPDVSLQAVASAIPELPVETPPPIDLRAYFDYIKATHAQQIETLTATYEKRIDSIDQHHKQTTRILQAVIIGLGAATLALAIILMI